MSSPADALLIALFQSQLLDANQAAAIRGWADERGADNPTVVRELTVRGWLTPFQAREIAAGRTRQLVIGKFVLVDLLGEGGMGRVFRARDSRLGRDVALKVIRKDKLSNPKVVDRFEQEIHAAAQLNHPNVVMAFDAETSGENYFLSMEYVEGTDLTKLVRQNGPMPMQHGCDAIRQAAVGLQHAFERGLVHRDIKPSNLLYTPRGQVKVLDLGLALLNQATVRGGENATRVTQEGFVLGTPDFLAPEQAQNPTGVDIRADIYALGATLYYLLTARVPFEAGTPTEKLLKHITEPPPNLLARRPDAPTQLATLIQWMMAKRPEDRPQTPAQVAMALTPFGLPPAASFPNPAPVPERAVPEPLPGASSENNAFAALDADSREEPLHSKRVRVRAPKRVSNLPLLVIGLGVVLTLCAGGCAGLIFFAYQAVESAKPFDDEITTAAGQIRLKKVDAGSFDMGSPENEPGHQPDEGPVRAVTLSSPFYIGLTEVTRKQFSDVTGQTLGEPSIPIHPDILPRLPAAVSWNEATDFLKKLNAKEKVVRPGWEYRLPTEAEWEYCARTGGKGGPFGRKARLTQYTDGIFKLETDDTYGDSNPAFTTTYTFDDKPCGIAAGATDRDHPFRREPNEWGLFDMTGNVWELCRDRYESYPTGPETDPTGPKAGTQRVARGGAFDTSATRCRAAARKMVDPARPARNVGFRIVYAPKISDK